MRKVHFSVKKIILCIVAVLSFLLFLVLSAVIRNLAGAQEAQQMAARWSEKKNVAQISCFFSPSTYAFQPFEYLIGKRYGFMCHFVNTPLLKVGEGGRRRSPRSSPPARPWKGWSAFRLHTRGRSTPSVRSRSRSSS